MKRLFILIFIIITIAGIFSRVLYLNDRPMHSDEANQAIKSGLLQEKGVYKYDPHEHHGPSLYYLSLPIAFFRSGKDFSGTTESTFRILPALFGIGLILLLLLLTNDLGRGPVICIAILTAVSPAMIFYSRFYIQEMMFVFFTFGAMIFGWKYFKTPKISSILLCGLFTGMIYATKETCIITFSSIIGALICNTVLRYLQDKQVNLKKILNLKHILLGFLAALFVSVLFYSSFFTNLQGVVDSLTTYSSYVQKGVGHNTTHVHPWYYYLQMLTYIRYGRGPVWSEGIIIILALVGIAAAFFRKKESHASNLSLLRFFSFYTIFMCIAYSIIPYKTPWCMISFLHGLIILAGYGAVVLVRFFKNKFTRGVICLLLVLALLHLARQAYLANSRYKADPRNPYVYAHTSMDFLNLVRRVEDIARVHRDRQNMFIAVIADPYNVWPSPWYLRKFTTVGYWTNVEDAPLNGNTPLIITSPDKIEEISLKIKNSYQIEYFGLRPEVLLVVYIRNDLWKAFLKSKPILLRD